ncbi:MAG: hypothetical protein EPN82_17115 [Bacteroidetes bacterium]|nr:MAG: hypothetical protein EPN82_17115 [Bacteroidota bacterium]
MKIWLLFWVESDSCFNYTPVFEIHKSSDTARDRYVELTNFTPDEFNENRGDSTQLVSEISLREIDV